MRARRGAIRQLVTAGEAISGTRRPNTKSGDEYDPDETRARGGQRGAHEERREYGADVLKARCWCQRLIVDVPAVLIRRTETLSCGHPKCAKEQP